MATRANIGIKLENGQYMMIYSHWDGYPRHVGKVLVNHFDSYEKAMELIEGTSIRSFHEGGSYERYEDGEADYYNSIEDALFYVDYVYFFIEKWRCYTHSSDPTSDLLEEKDLYIYV